MSARERERYQIAVTEREKPRVKGRSMALFDLSISSDAFRLYCVIDDHAGVSGVAWPGQRRLMTMTGFSRRRFFRALAELRERHVSITKDGRKAIYTLQWVPRVAPIEENRCQNEQEQVPRVSPIRGSILNEPVPEPDCELCEDESWVEDPQFGRVPCTCKRGKELRARLTRRRA